MDININPASVVKPIYTTPIGKKEETSFADNAENLDKSNKKSTYPTSFDNQDNNYEKVIKDASQQYAISDQTFTIFKDSSGKYITRYTSLRDGSVTYVPEATLVKSLPSSQIDKSKISVPLLSIQA
jgi:hypothetical protein